MVFALVGRGFGAGFGYDLSAWCPAVEVEDLDEVVPGLVGLGEHAAGLGASSGGGVDQDGLFDAGEGG